MKKHKDFLFILLFCFSFSVFTTTLIHQLTKEPTEYIQVEVKPGDTIWDYAQLFREHHQLSTEHFIDWVLDTNQLTDGNIQVGQSLLLPIPKQEKELVE